MTPKAASDASGVLAEPAGRVEGSSLIDTPPSWLAGFGRSGMGNWGRSVGSPFVRHPAALWHWARQSWFGSALALLVSAICCTPGWAQDAMLDRLPSATVERGCRIDGHAADLVPIAWLGVSPRGTIALVQTQDHAVRFFDSTCVALGSVGRQGRGPGEFEYPRRGGWTGDSMWVSDTDLNRTTVISPSGTVARTLRPMSMARPDPANEAQVNRYMQVVPYGMYAGDTLLVLGLLPTGGAAATSGSAGELLRVSGDGVIERVVLSLPVDEKGFVEMGAVPFYPQPKWTVAPDGSRIATLTFSLPGERPATFHVIVVDALGQPVFARSVQYEPVRIPASVADDAVSARAARSRLIQPTSAMRAEMRRAIPAVYPPAVDIVIGSDKRVWVQLRETSDGSPYLVIAPNGALLGRVLLPRGSRLGAAGPNAIWAIERDSVGVESVVRYSFNFGVGRRAPDEMRDRPEPVCCQLVTRHRL